MGDDDASNSTGMPSSPLPSQIDTNQFIASCISGNDQEESATWLNSLIQELWPYAANISQFMVLEYVQPALKASMPIGLPAPKFSKIDIGTKAPVIEKIRVAESKLGKNESAAVIEADVIFESENLDIQMTYSDFTFGVNEVKVYGRMEVVLRPLLNHVPLIGAGQVAFINTPTFEYNLTGLAALGNQRLIRSVIRKVVESVTGSIAVLPNRVAYKSSPDVDYFGFSTQPIGVLRVAALSGEGFPSTDRDIFKQTIGLSELPDVYLVLKHGNVTFQTERVDDSANPEYKNQIFDFVLTSESRSQLLKIEAYDYDLGINNDDYLGSASVMVTDLVNDGISELELEGSPENATPKVKLAAKWLNMSSNLRHVQHAIMSQRSDSLRPKSCSALLLTVDIDEAQNLPPDKRPYVTLSVGTHKFQTMAAYNLPGMFSVEHPEFEQSFQISLKDDADASVRIEFRVIDQTSSKLLGWAFCSLSEAVEAGPAGRKYDFALMGAQKPNARLRVRTKLAAIIDHPTPLWEVLADTGNKGTS